MQLQQIVLPNQRGADIRANIMVFFFFFFFFLRINEVPFIQRKTSEFARNKRKELWGSILHPHPII